MPKFPPHARNFIPVFETVSEMFLTHSPMKLLVEHFVSPMSRLLKQEKRGEVEEEEEEEDQVEKKSNIYPCNQNKRFP